MISLFMTGLYDFHTHTVLSDGDLLPIESIRRAKVLGYQGIALTDHIGATDSSPILQILNSECKMGSEAWGINSFFGVEITHVPVKFISKIASKARKAGAQIIIVHGETIVEPVEKGTNWAAVNSNIDILAHPGFISHREAQMAAKNGIFIEITSRVGHSYTNGHVVSICRQEGTDLLLNSDAHTIRDMINYEIALKIARGAGLSNKEIKAAMIKNPIKLVARLV
jgi:putative hydrolase